MNLFRMPSTQALMDQATSALEFGENDLDVLELWAACLLQAQHAAEDGTTIPEHKVYKIEGGEYYGFRVGRWPLGSDCGIGRRFGRTVIRVHAVELGLRSRFYGALVRLFQPRRDPVFYFALDDDGDVEISEEGKAVMQRYMQQGTRAVIGAMRAALEALR